MYSKLVCFEELHHRLVLVVFGWYHRLDWQQLGIAFGRCGSSALSALFNVR